MQLSAQKVYIYDTRRNTAELGKTDDIQQGQTALVRVADELVKEVVILNNTLCRILRRNGD